MGVNGPDALFLILLGFICDVCQISVELDRKTGADLNHLTLLGFHVSQPSVLEAFTSFQRGGIRWKGLCVH